MNYVIFIILTSISMYLHILLLGKHYQAQNICTSILVGILHTYIHHQTGKIAKVNYRYHMFIILTEFIIPLYYPVKPYNKEPCKVVRISDITNHRTDIYLSSLKKSKEYIVEDKRSFHMYVRR